MPKHTEPDPDSAPGDDLTLDDFDDIEEPDAGTCTECGSELMDGECTDITCPEHPENADFEDEDEDA